MDAPVPFALKLTNSFPGTALRSERTVGSADGDTASGPRRRRAATSSVVRFGELGHVNKNIHDRVQVHPKGNDPRMKRDDIGYPCA
ncbi:hypothetical protein EVAR_98095_1 [Eumeta japonica]|uniref:Uncharacterized protein n=1 Tax=Eumeta variegata TaxID=151549 RepID=A0A4C1XLE7_EUMVA|nr:hypothetical protein EVAR_98095_1 [Eumeta japonica]